MTMKLVADFPPNIELIRQHFALSGNEIFTYGDTVYNPTGEQLPPWLKAHEAVHIKQQQDVDPGVWWDRYLRDPGFRLEMELPAHQVEYAIFYRHCSVRNVRRAYLKTMARRLSGPIYGHMIGYAEAMKKIRGKGK